MRPKCDDKLTLIVLLMAAQSTSDPNRMTEFLNLQRGRVGTARSSERVPLVVIISVLSIHNKISPFVRLYFRSISDTVELIAVAAVHSDERNDICLMYSGCVESTYK